MGEILKIRPDIRIPTARHSQKLADLARIAEQNAHASRSVLPIELNPNSGKGIPVTIKPRTRPNQQEFECELEHDIMTPFLTLCAGEIIKVDPFVTCLVCPKDYDPWADTSVVYNKDTDWLISEAEFVGQWELFGHFFVTGTMSNAAFLCSEAYRICD